LSSTDLKLDYPERPSVITKSLNRPESKKEEPERWQLENITNIDDFEYGERGPLAKECEHSLEAIGDKELDEYLSSPKKGIQPCQHIDF
jgi:hypothetical protein